MMKTKSFFITVSIVCLAFLSDKAPAQWVQSNFPTSNQVTDLKFYGNVLYVTTYGGGIFQSQNFTTWSPSNTGISTSNINEIITSIEGTNINLYAATDAGVFRSTMLGFNWTAVNNGLTNLNVGTVFSDGNVLYAGTPGGAFRSVDYGLLWTPMTIGAPSQVVSCFYKNGSDMLAGLIGVGQYLYRSTDQGLTWEPYGTGVYEIQQIDGLDGELFALSGTVIYHSLDNGATWNLVGPGLVPGMPVSDITTGNDYWWIATYAGGYVQHTDSANFRMITTGMPMGGSNLSAVARNDNWIVYGTVNNGIWYEAESVVTGLDNESSKLQEMILSPNPVIDKFRVSGAFVQKQEWGYSVMDFTGQISSSGMAKGDATIDVRNLSSGIYFIRVNSEHRSIVKKIIKL